MRRAPCGMRFKRCLPAAFCCNRRLWRLAAEGGMGYGARLGATFELKLWAMGRGLWALRGALRGIML